MKETKPFIPIVYEKGSTTHIPAVINRACPPNCCENQIKQAISARDKEWREKIEALQGEWVGVAETYCPDWVLDLRYILSEMEALNDNL
jgi:hypothetical protein